METQAPYTAVKKKIAVTTKITPPPQDYHTEISVPFFSKTRDTFYKIIDENSVAIIQFNGKGKAAIGTWSDGTVFYRDALTAIECTEQEFISAYNKAKQFIENQIL